MVEEIERLISRGRSAGGGQLPRHPGACRRVLEPRAGGDDPRPAQPCLGMTRGLAVPTYWMRQLDPGRSDCASFGLAYG